MRVERERERDRNGEGSGEKGDERWRSRSARRRCEGNAERKRAQARSGKWKRTGERKVRTIKGETDDKARKSERGPCSQDIARGCVEAPRDRTRRRGGHDASAV